MLINSKRNWKKSEIDTLYKVFLMTGQKCFWELFLQKVQRQRKFRFALMAKLRFLRQGAAERHDHQLVVTLDQLKIEFTVLVDEAFPVEKIEREPVTFQDYLTPCRLLLGTNAKRPSLSEYENRRSGTPVDRYYFGRYSES